MVYLRELPAPLREIDDDFIEFFFNFANSYTEDGVRDRFLKERSNLDSEPSEDVAKELGYSDKDILSNE